MYNLKKKTAIISDYSLLEIWDVKGLWLLRDNMSILGIIKLFSINHYDDSYMKSNR